jgi:hypothetical protein
LNENKDFIIINAKGEEVNKSHTFSAIYAQFSTSEKSFFVVQDTKSNYGIYSSGGHYELLPIYTTMERIPGKSIKLGAKLANKRKWHIIEITYNSKIIVEEKDSCIAGQKYHHIPKR